MWVNMRTEYSFRSAYGHIDQVAEKCALLGDCGGIADVGNTFGHIRWRKACKKVGIKPIYGVRLPVFEDVEVKERRLPFNNMTFIAKTQEGLQEIYALVDLAYQQFYYNTRISYDQVNSLGNGVIILSGVAPNWGIIKHPNVFQELGLNIPFATKESFRAVVATIDNFYPNIEDKIVYEPFAESRLLERKTYPLHIPTQKEWLLDFPGREDALANLKIITDACTVELPQAPMVEYIGNDNVQEWCELGARKHGLDIWNDGKYKDRYDREIQLIFEKGYADYFLVVADLIRFAKDRMAVGPSRGSSAGSLVCYLMGITEIDPLEYDLYFERFIDVNRSDLPDIDVDFQDDKRHLCFKYLEKKYGKDNVAQIANISRMKPKSAIQRFAQSLNIPLNDVEELKDAIMERSGGDARANSCMEDTFKDTDIGKNFLEKYPEMQVVEKIEAHALHTGVHAAGILVCNKPITAYAGINCRDNKRIAMLDKKDAEAIDLLKIDALGLRTLSILAAVCDQIGKPYEWLYEIPLDDVPTYKVFNDQRYNGIFQFEGPAVNGLAKQMIVEDIEDIAALTALGRPGPLNSGGANRYIKFRSGKESVKYVHDHPLVVEALEPTYGVVIYQEQVMKIVRELGKLSWKDTSAIRKAMSKSLGVEFFDKMWKNFKKGCEENGLIETDARKIWDNINTMGSWSFNKSHAVSYGLISYLCAYMKANYPLEFVVACLNHAKSDQSALKILRDAVENDGVEYQYIDWEKSGKYWTVQDGILYGGLMTIFGIAAQKANQVIKCRAEGKSFPKGIQASINKSISTFKYLYPGKELYGDFYDDPQSLGLLGSVTEIKDTQDNGTFTVIGCMIKKNLRDANEACFVNERAGKYENGQTSWLNITLEDDTGSVMCKIKKDDYLRLGKEVAETGKVDKDWYIVYGEKINGWSLIFTKNIQKITRDI